MLSNSQAGPGRKVKQEQDEISRNHVQPFYPISVELNPNPISIIRQMPACAGTARATSAEAPQQHHPGAEPPSSAAAAQSLERGGLDDRPHRRRRRRRSDDDDGDVEPLERRRPTVAEQQRAQRGPAGAARGPQRKLGVSNAFGLKEMRKEERDCMNSPIPIGKKEPGKEPRLKLNLS